MHRSPLLLLGLCAAALATGCAGDSDEVLASEAAAVDTRVIQWNPRAGTKTYFVSTLSDEGIYTGENITISLTGNGAVPVSGDGPTIAAAYSFHFVRLAEENAQNYPVQEALGALRLPEFPGTPTAGASYTSVSGPETTDDTVLQMRTSNTTTITRVMGPVIQYETVSKYRITANAAWQQFKATHLQDKPVDWVTGQWTTFRVTTGSFDTAKGILVQSRADSIWPSFPTATRASVLADPNRRVESVQLING